MELFLFSLFSLNWAIAGVRLHGTAKQWLQQLQSLVRHQLFFISPDKYSSVHPHSTHVKVDFNDGPKDTDPPRLNDNLPPRPKVILPPSIFTLPEGCTFCSDVPPLGRWDTSILPPHFLQLTYILFSPF